MTEIKIKSIQDFINSLPETKHGGYTRFFRGHSDKTYDIEPSIYRKNKETGKKELIKGEHLIIRDVLTECAEYFSPHDTFFDKLVRMQHYGYPTRLLDVSYSALVGLYFAVNQNNGINQRNIQCKDCQVDNIIDDDLKDGEVIIFDIPNDTLKYHDSDTVAILSALSLQNNDFNLNEISTISKYFSKRDQALYLKNEKDIAEFLESDRGRRDLYDEMQNLVYEIGKLPDSERDKIINPIVTKTFNNQEHIVRLLNDVRNDKPYFLPIINRHDLEKVILVKPRANNPRIVRQQGAFLIFGIQESKEEQAIMDENWIATKEKRLIIDAQSKQGILEQLSSFGISHQTLFPELDSQARYIIERHKDKSTKNK